MTDRFDSNFSDFSSSYENEDAGNWQDEKVKESSTAYKNYADELAEVESFDSIVPESAFRTGHMFLLPVHYEEKYEYPLVVWLHDDGNNETQLKQVMPHISLRNYIAVGVRATKAADSIGHCFNWSDSKSAVHQAYESVVNLIDECSERFSINTDRVVLAGYRSGGSMAMRIAFRDPNRFAGVVSMGGYLPKSGHAFSSLHKLRDRKMPMLWQWGLENPSFCMDRLAKDLTSAQMAQLSLLVQQYTGTEDEMSTEVLADIDRWIMNRIVAGNPNSSFGGDEWQTREVPFSGN